MPPALLGWRLREVGQKDDRGNFRRRCGRGGSVQRVGHSGVGAGRGCIPCPVSGCRGDSRPARGVGRESLTRGYRGARLPDCSPAAYAGAYPTGARLVWVEGQERPSSWGARGARKPPCRGDATGGRAPLAKRVVYTQHTACLALFISLNAAKTALRSLSSGRAASYPIHQIRKQKLRRDPESDSIRRTTRGRWHSASLRAMREALPLALSGIFEQGNGQGFCRIVVAASHNLFAGTSHDHGCGNCGFLPSPLPG
jgi:hypothetical protein